MIVKYIEHKNIDKEKWDSCINNSVNGLIYAKSFFLDNMAENWDGVIVGDYEAIMPITWKNKWGIRYLYQPAFLQQGGIFFKTAVSEANIQQVFNTIITKFKFAEITGNYLNAPLQHIPYLKINARNNFTINLNQDYSNVFDSYTFSCKKSLKRVKKFALLYKHSDNFSEIIELYKNLYGPRLPYVLGKDYDHFKKLCKEISGKQNVITRQVYNTRGELLCAVILLNDAGRLYNIISCVTAAGKQAEANYFLYDNIFQEFSGQSLIFDFEGSDIPGIANFYLKFSPENHPYPFIKFNNLNPILKLFKQ